MFDFIPIESYYDLYINVSLGVVLFTILHSYILKVDDPRNLSYINVIGYLLLIFIVVYTGLRPVSGRFFGDMSTYNTLFLTYASGIEITTNQDLLFHYFVKFCSGIMTPTAFFLLCMFLYTYPLYIVSKRIFKEYWFYSFLMFVISFSFWSYGTNGIRNGLATSCFLLAVSYYDKKIIMIFLFVIASQVHQTLLLPIFAFILSSFYPKTKFFLISWVMSIPLSIALGGFWESLFASLGFGDDRLGTYLLGDFESEEFKSTGFRYDFLVYSASAVFVGWYFIFKKGFTDRLYTNLFNTYVISNAFWVLVIRANFSNRFAYLSWFMMGLVIIYPYLKEQYYKNQHIVLVRVITIYFSFTYFMYYIYYK